MEDANLFASAGITYAPAIHGPRISFLRYVANTETICLCREPMEVAGLQL